MKKLFLLLMVLPSFAFATEAKDVLKLIRQQKAEILVQTLLQTETLLRKNGFNNPPDLVFIVADEHQSDPTNRRFVLSYFFYRPSQHTPIPGCVGGQETVSMELRISAPNGDLTKAKVNNVGISSYLQPDSCLPGGVSSGG
jgi:hypothetical protein